MSETDKLMRAVRRRPRQGLLFELALVPMYVPSL